MAYRIAGRYLDFCSCNVACPCVFGQVPDGGRCLALALFAIDQGNADGVNLAGTKVALAVEIPGVWSKGNWTAALILDANASQQQRDALQSIFTGQMKGDAAQLVALVGNFKGVTTAPISFTYAAGKASLKAGDLAEAAGETLKNVQGTAEIQLTNANYVLPNLTAGKCSTVKANVLGLKFDINNRNMYVAPFELKG